MAWRDPRDGTGLWWKLVNRNKRTVALDLKVDADREVLLRLVDDADVLVENFRPGHAGAPRPRPRRAARPAPVAGDHPRHRLRAGRAVRQPARLRHHRRGDVGPRARSAASPTASRCCRRSRSPTRSPAWSPRSPRWWRVHTGVGQVVDVNLLESMFQLMGPLISLYRLTGEQQPRLGAGLPYTVPRGTYRCSDGKWVAVSTSVDSVAARVIRRARRRRRRAVRHLRRPDGAPRRARGDDGGVVRCAGRRPRCWPRSPRPRRRSAR